MISETLDLNSEGDQGLFELKDMDKPLITMEEYWAEEGMNNDFDEYVQTPVGQETKGEAILLKLEKFVTEYNVGMGPGLICFEGVQLQKLDSKIFDCFNSVQITRLLLQKENKVEL